MTDERLKEILQMVLEDRSSDYLCYRLEYIWNSYSIDDDEYIFVNTYMFRRRPFKHRKIYWWASDYTTKIEYEEWLQIKHTWLQNLINEL